MCSVCEETRQTSPGAVYGFHPGGRLGEASLPLVGLKPDSARCHWGGIEETNISPPYTVEGTCRRVGRYPGMHVPLRAACAAYNTYPEMATPLL